MHRIVLAVVLALIAFPYNAISQVSSETKAPRNELFFDTKDGALDLSGFLNTARGFLPVAGVITEPAVGYGGMFGLMFLHDSRENRAKEVSADTTGGHLMRLSPPSASAVGGFLTENDSWGAFLYHLGIYKNDSIRYVGGLFYSDMQLDYFGRGGSSLLPIDSVAYSLAGTYFIQQASFRVGSSDLFVGANFKYMSFDSALNLDLDFDLPEWVPPLERRTKSSGAGLIMEFDSRNTVFSPDYGFNATAQAVFYREALGSDKDYFKGLINIRGWVPVSNSVVLGMRADANFSGDGTPFYMLPSVDMRGISLTRYQGQHTMTTEVELRWDFTKRWSLLGFYGSGWVAENEFSDYSLDAANLSGGTGFRYLISRVFGIRTGMDFAWSEDDFAFYFTTGTAWGQK
jgi:hypothetical protein